MKKQKYIPYFFDYKYEKRTYKYVGRDYGNSAISNKGWIGNFVRWFRKHIYNRNESKYKICDTYEEWESYVKNNLRKRVDNKNFMHWLIMQKRLAENELEAVKAILIPIYIALLTIKEILPFEGNFTWDKILILIISIIILSVVILYINKEKVDFWEDWIKIVKNNNNHTSHQ